MCWPGRSRSRTPPLRLEATRARPHHRRRRRHHRCLSHSSVLVSPLSAAVIPLASACTPTCQCSYSRRVAPLDIPIDHGRAAALTRSHVAPVATDSATLCCAALQRHACAYCDRAADEVECATCANSTLAAPGHPAAHQRSARYCFCAMHREPRDPCRRMMARAATRTQRAAPTPAPKRHARSRSQRDATPRGDRSSAIDRAPLLRFVCGVCGAAAGRAAQRLGRAEAPRAEERRPADAVNKGTGNRSKGADNRSKGTERPRHHERRSGVRLGVRSASSSPAVLPNSKGNRKIKRLPPLCN